MIIGIDLGTTNSAAAIWRDGQAVLIPNSVGDFLTGMPGVLTGDNRNSGAIDVNVRGMQGFGRVPVVVDGTQPPEHLHEQVIARLEVMGLVAADPGAAP